MGFLPATSESVGTEVLAFRKGEAFTKGCRRVLPGPLGTVMKVDQQSQKATAIPAGTGDPNSREDVRLLQHNRTREK